MGRADGHCRRDDGSDSAVPRGWTKLQTDVFSLESAVMEMATSRNALDLDEELRVMVLPMREVE
jgi:hypothetical protein